MLERALQLQPAAADIAQVVAQQAQRRRASSIGRSGLLHALLVDQHAPGQHQRVARSRDAANPRSTSALSSLIFIRLYKSTAHRAEFRIK